MCCYGGQMKVVGWRPQVFNRMLMRRSRLTLIIPRSSLRTAQRQTTASRSMRPPRRGQHLGSGLKGACKMLAQTCNSGHLTGGGDETHLGGLSQLSAEKRRRLRERRKATLFEPIFSLV